ncbi:hypothetical protein [Flavobacterium sp. NRK1]|uniref:hypothetical protein n=1 Tax=Flavobacterium sp. NRK1 TaxID=2954929 RepID=UPI002092000E|nr:hypothetical protein [Flavobacterium sp. NRK1]MCO6147045.1 hypothetical protein [Flavobacterium sp. NRK1]
MKTFKRIFILIFVSAIIATGLFFINSNIIVNNFTDKIFEIAFLTIPVFIILTILLYVNRALVKTIRNTKKKKPSGEEGFNN